MRIAFDVDGTLIKKDILGNDIPRYEVIDVLRNFQNLGHSIFIWSGGGVDYATRWAEKLGFHTATILTKDEFHNIDICFDDEEVTLANVNVRV